jgi:hypothetical protein
LGWPCDFAQGNARRSALDAASACAKKRHGFGAAIFNHQAVSFRRAE